MFTNNTILAPPIDCDSFIIIDTPEYAECSYILRIFTRHKNALKFCKLLDEYPIFRRMWVIRNDKDNMSKTMHKICIIEDYYYNKDLSELVIDIRTNDKCINKSSINDVSLELFNDPHHYTYSLILK